jgi:hypothetical protein
LCTAIVKAASEAKCKDLIVITWDKDEDYSCHIKRGLVFFDEAEKGLKDVVFLKESLQYPINQIEWEEIKRFFTRIVL